MFRNTIDQSNKLALERAAGRQEHTELSMSVSRRKPQKPVEGKMNVEGVFPVNIDSPGTLDFTQALIKYSLYAT